ncbi:hypothetical protein ACJX0J_030727, partial [Zea mays]
ILGWMITLVVYNKWLIFNNFSRFFFAQEQSFLNILGKIDLPIKNAEAHKIFAPTIFFLTLVQITGLGGSLFLAQQNFSLQKFESGFYKRNWKIHLSQFHLLV